MVNSRWWKLELVVGVMLALVAASAFAGQITVYERPGFDGRSVILNDSLPVLERSTFNSVASSVSIADGTWEACTEAYFRGTCAQLVPGNYSRLSDQLRGYVASVRPIAYPASARVVVSPDTPYPATAAVVVSPDQTPVIVRPAPTIAEGTVVPSGPRVVLYQRTASNGWRAVEVTSNVSDLDDRYRAFGTRADAAFVSGGVWRLCDRESGRGHCADFPPGQYTTLGNLEGRVRSATLIATTTEPVATVRPIPLGRAMLYEFPNYAGHSALIAEGRAPDLDWANFRSPLASSAHIESGTWLVCTQMAYQGDCLVLGPGDYPMLTGINGIASARQVWSPDYVASNGWRFDNQLMSRNYVATP